MKIRRRFTVPGEGPYRSIPFETRNSRIRSATGEVIFQQDDIEVPRDWSQLAVDILAQKYFRKAQVPAGFSPYGRENSARQVFHRMAHTWTRWGKKYRYFDREEDADAFYDELCYMLATQMAAPNSPQWFNTGLYDVYGIKGPPQGHFYVEPESGRVKKSRSAYERPQPHACFILDVKDDLVNEGGITDTLRREAMIFKYGSGSGSNFSRIRGKDEPLSGGGLSSGLLSFLKVNDRSAAAVKSGGTTRRAAKMVTLDMDHPDIGEYINWKTREEYKVVSMVVGSKILTDHTGRIQKICRERQKEESLDPTRNPPLARAIREALKDSVPANYIYRIIQLARQDIYDISLEEYDTQWDTEAYNTVSGQCSNNSVRMDRTFMESLENDGSWQLKWRTDPRQGRRVKSRDLFDRVVLNAWNCADPGVQFHTTINEWHTCRADGEIRASNPCSEYMFLDDTACNLASINLLKFFRPSTGKIDVNALRHAVSLWTVALEISVLMAQFPSREIARNSYRYRTLGLGFANLGALLMAMGIPYDSEPGRNIAAALSALLTGEAYHTSSAMAARLGTFPAYRKNREDMLRVIRNHRRAAYGADESEYEGVTVFPRALDPQNTPDYLLAAARLSWDRALASGNRHGFRNAQVSAVAPTGTIGLLMDCDTTGIEPDFSLVKYKKLAGGGHLKIINQALPRALKKLGYAEEQVREVIRYCLGSGTLKGAEGVSAKALQKKKFTREALQRVEAGIQSVISLDPLFSPAFLGESFVEEQLGIPRERWSGSEFCLLEELGFSKRDISRANQWICGTKTIEGAPHLKAEHYAVFDTANQCGVRGTRLLSWQAHVEMMASVQPFISGAISKTINMPHNARVQDIRDAYLQAYRGMLKSLTVYRDSSKLSQPLNGVNLDTDPLARGIFDLASRPEDSSGGTESPTRRHRLPGKRDGYTQKAKIAGHSLFLRTGEYPDGSLGEIFLDMHKEGAAFRSLLNCFAISVSLGLQYGVPLEEFVDAFTFTRFEPNGMVLGHDNIKMATSVIDFIFRDLAFSYLDRSDLVQVKSSHLVSTETQGREKSGQKTTAAPKAPNAKGHDDPSNRARLRGYAGDPCPSCGHFTLVRNGTCFKCETCGSTTGCS